MSGFQCFAPLPRVVDAEGAHRRFAAMLRASLEQTERRRCAARKGWRTRRKEQA